METETTTRYIVTIWHDDDGHNMNPNEEESLFKLHSFNNRHINFTDPDKVLGREGWRLSYYEHGLCRWDLAGTIDYPDAQWDSVSFAGFLEVVVPDNERDWWNGETQEFRDETAKVFVETYTSWANGEVYGYTIESQTPPIECNQGYTHTERAPIDSCGGFIGSKWFAEALREALPDDATEDNTRVFDEAYGMAEYLELWEGETH